MFDVLHIYDNAPAMPAWEGLLPGHVMVYSPCAVADFSLEILLQGQFHLIVFDVSGKKKSAAAIFQQLEKWIELSGISRPAIIVIVERGTDLSEQTARMAGADFFFIKPVDMKDLSLVFDQIVSSMHISQP